MLTNRQLLILQLTVDDFIESAQPVGSRQLSEKNGSPFSSATIRNEMADLEEMGYLKRHIPLQAECHLKKDTGFMSIIY